MKVTKKAASRPLILEDYCEWDATEGKDHRIAMYRKFACLDESCDITEDNIDQWALDKTSCKTNCSRERLIAELTGREWA